MTKVSTKECDKDYSTNVDRIEERFPHLVVEAEEIWFKFDRTGAVQPLDLSRKSNWLRFINKISSPYISTYYLLEWRQLLFSSLMWLGTFFLLVSYVASLQIKLRVLTIIIYIFQVLEIGYYLSLRLYLVLLPHTSGKFL